MSLLKTLLALYSKKALLNLALDLLWKFLGRLATDALTYVKEAEAHDDWDADQKRRYVLSCLKAAYHDLNGWKWLINIALELAVGKLSAQNAKGALKSAAILEVAR